jgi:hypothetical protein
MLGCVWLSMVGHKPIWATPIASYNGAICNLMEATPLGAPDEQFQIKIHQFFSHRVGVLFMLI